MSYTPYNGNLSDYRPDPSLASYWGATVSDKLFWRFSDQTNCTLFSNNCSGHGECSPSWNPFIFECRCQDLFDPTTMCSIDFFQIWQRREPWFFVITFLALTFVTLLILYDLMYDVVKKNFKPLKGLAKFLMLLWCLAEYIYLGLFLASYQKGFYEYEWPRTLFVEFSNIILSLIFDTVCLFWLSMAIQVAQLSETGQKVLQYGAYATCLLILLSSLAGSIGNLVTLQFLNGAWIFDLFSAICYSTAYLVLCLWCIINGLYFYHFFKAIPEAKTVNYKNVTLVVMACAVAAFMLAAVVFYRLDGRSIPNYYLGFALYYHLTRMFSLVVALMLVSSSVFSIVVSCCCPQTDPDVDGNTYYKMHDDEPLEARGSFWDDLDDQTEEKSRKSSKSRYSIQL